MKTVHLNDNWKFYYGDISTAWEKRYKPEGWKTVDVPHDWSVTMPFSKEFSSGTAYLAGGIAWYRKSFKLSEDYKDKVIELVFDGVYKNGQVWINGYYLGMRPNGYIGFEYDISDFVCFGEDENIISVKVEHADIADSRWFTGSGITRKVSLRAYDKVYLNTDSIFFKTICSDTESADIEISAEILNAGCEEVDAKVEFRLCDSEGKEAVSFSENYKVSANSDMQIKIHGKVKNPMLWSIDNPNLYLLTAKVCDDEQKLNIGIRSFEFDSDKGFSLNGKSVKMKGVCVHHDAGCLGAAVYKDVWKRRLEKLKGAGCNSIRMSHNPAMPELYDLCDEMGFLVMDEAFDEWEGVKNKWQCGHNVYPPAHQGYSKDFPQWHKKDLEAMVLRDRNHPSIVMWSVGNEIDYPNDPYCHPLFSEMTGNNDKNKPEEERMFDARRPNSERLIPVGSKLRDIVLACDDTRPVVIASAFPELSAKIGLVDIFDVVCYNYKEHLYDEDHKQYADKAFLGSENRHEVDCWRAVQEREFVCGQFLWTGVDFLGEAHGWPIRGSQVGLLDLAGYEKPMYYYRKSLWSEKPVVSMLTNIADQKMEYELFGLQRKWNYIPGDVIDVYCYSNAEEVEVIVNGKSQGKKSVDYKLGYAKYQVEFEEGVIEAVVSDEDNFAEDCLQTSMASCDICLNIWGDKNDEIVQVECTMIDSNGNRACTDNTRLYFETEGEVKILGIENGDQSDLTEYSAKYKRAHNGRLVVYLKKENKSDAKLIVKSPGMRTRTIKV